VDDSGMRRIGEDPYEVPPRERDLSRRLRGRLAAPVTVWTSTSSEGRPVGITVSSVLVGEGEPPVVLGLIGTLTDFWDAVQDSRHFVVHVLAEDQRRMADEFAGRYTQVNFTAGWTAAPATACPARGDVAGRLRQASARAAPHPPARTGSRATLGPSIAGETTLRTAISETDHTRSWRSR